MAFYDAYETLKKALKNAKGKDVQGHLAVELVITDEENAGIAYLEVGDGMVRIEPYDYFDHDARLIGRSDDLAAVLSGKVDFDTAIAQEKLFIEGDLERAMLVKTIIRKPSLCKYTPCRTFGVVTTVKLPTAPHFERSSGTGFLKLSGCCISLSLK